MSVFEKVEHLVGEDGMLQIEQVTEHLECTVLLVDVYGGGGGTVVVIFFFLACGTARVVGICCWMGKMGILTGHHSVVNVASICFESFLVSLRYLSTWLLLFGWVLLLLRRDV